MSGSKPKRSIILPRSHQIAITLAAPTVRLRAWLASDVPSARRDVVVSPASCGLEVSSGAPWLDGHDLAAAMVALGSDPSIALRPVRFEPTR